VLGYYCIIKYNYGTMSWGCSYNVWWVVYEPTKFLCIMRFLHREKIQRYYRFCS